MVPSVRNSLSMNLSLLKRTNCNKIFYSQELAQKVQELREERPSIVAIPMPSLEELLESRPHHYPYDKIFDEVENDPIIIVHTSGSTGECRHFISLVKVFVRKQYAPRGRPFECACAMTFFIKFGVHYNLLCVT